MRSGRRSEEQVEKDVRALARFLGTKKPKTLREIRERFGISTSTAYRWIDRIPDTTGDLVIQSVPGPGKARLYGLHY